jgi:uncharacterized protein YbjT (DUF2867 family)
MSSDPVLLTGANGRTGRALLRALVERGTAVRAFVRDPRQRESLAALGAAECTVGDLRDRQALRTAATGCSAVVHVGPPMHVDEVPMTCNALDVASAAGVRRFVYYSVLRPSMRGVHHHERKLEAERAVVDSGLPFTIVQPARYMQHLEPMLERIRRDGVHEMPFGVDAKFDVVDLADVAAATARVVADEGHAYATYELAGPEPLSQRDMAAVLAEILGRPVEARRVPLETLAAKARAAGADEARIENMLAMNAHYDRHGFRGNSNVLGWLLGRPPTTYREYVRRVAGV